MDQVQTYQYQGFDVEFEVIEGQVYANATSMCKPFGKNPYEWSRLVSTIRYAEALKALRDFPASLSISRKGGINGGGYFLIHEKLILKLAQWLDVTFEIWCDEQIARLLKTNQQAICLHSYQIDDPIKRAKQWIREEEERQSLRFENSELKPKADYAETVLLSQSTLTTTKIAQELGLSAIKLNRLLRSRGIQYFQSGMWNLTSRYVGKGYAKLSTFHHPGSDGSIRTEHSLVWTELGRQFIHSLVNPAMNLSITTQSVAHA